MPCCSRAAQPPTGHTVVIRSPHLGDLVADLTMRVPLLKPVLWGPACAHAPPQPLPAEAVLRSAEAHRAAGHTALVHVPDAHYAAVRAAAAPHVLHAFWYAPIREMVRGRAPGQDLVGELVCDVPLGRGCTRLGRPRAVHALRTHSICGRSSGGREGAVSSWMCHVGFVVLLQVHVELGFLV